MQFEPSVFSKEQRAKAGTIDAYDGDDAKIH